MAVLLIVPGVYNSDAVLLFVPVSAHQTLCGNSASLIEFSASKGGTNMKADLSQQNPPWWALLETSIITFPKCRSLPNWITHTLVPSHLPPLAWPSTGPWMQQSATLRGHKLGACQGRQWWGVMGAPLPSCLPSQSIHLFSFRKAKYKFLVHLIFFFQNNSAYSYREDKDTGIWAIPIAREQCLGKQSLRRRFWDQSNLPQLNKSLGVWRSKQD